MTHNNSMRCPACNNGMCRYVKVNSLVPYEEIEAEVKRRRMIEKAEEYVPPKTWRKTH